MEVCIVFTLFFPYPIETTHNLCISRFAKLVGWVAILWQRLCHIQLIVHSDTTKHHIWHYKTVKVIRIVFKLFLFVSMKLPNCISYLMNSKSQPETCPNIKHEVWGWDFFFTELWFTKCFTIYLQDCWGY